MKNRRFKTDYSLSAKAREVHEVILAAFPYYRLYVEYPYTRILKTYYKKNKTAKALQDPFLLSLTKLKADFVLPDLGVIIEVDGEQHFEPVQFGGISADEALINFEEQKNRDFKKKLIAAECEHKLIRIRYDEKIDEEALFRMIGES